MDQTKTPGERRELIDLLIAHEKAMEDLYRQFGRLFPARTALFEAIADEEVAHAAAIRTLAEGAVGGKPAAMTEHLIKLPALRTSLKCIREQVLFLRSNGPSLIGALNIALGFERALIEKAFFKTFVPDGPEVGRVLEGLASGTEGHLHRLEELREELAAVRTEHAR